MCTAECRLRLHCASEGTLFVQLETCLPEVFVQVAAAATEAMLAACGTAGNRDLEPHIPALVGAAISHLSCTRVWHWMAATQRAALCAGRLPSARAAPTAALL